LLGVGIAYCVAHAFVWLGAHTSFRKEIPDFDHFALRSALASSWLVPVVLFIFDRSEWAAVALAVLTTSIGRLFFAISARDDAATHPDQQPPEPFLLLQRSALDFAIAIFAGIAASAGGSALVVSRLALASALSVLATLLILWRFRRERPPAISKGSRPISPTRTSVRLSAAALVTLLALLPHMVIPGQYGGRQLGGSTLSLVDALKALFGLWGSHSIQTGTPLAPRVFATGTALNGNAHLPGTPYPGVLLWSDRPQNVTRLVAPPASNSVGATDAASEPVVIPFDGVYWLMRSPDAPPGRDALVTYGSPVKRSFRSNDYRSLWMEAHQDLGRFIEARCCRAIELQVTDNDLYSPDVGLELVLTNSTMRTRGSQSLGTMRVAEPLTTGNTRPEERRLRFQMPSVGLARFDELTVRYWLGRTHRLQSARIAIDNFVLLPR
jgi:hypothetical protein